MSQLWMDSIHWGVVQLRTWKLEFPLQSPVGSSKGSQINHLKCDREFIPGERFVWWTFCSAEFRCFGYCWLWWLPQTSHMVCMSDRWITATESRRESSSKIFQTLNIPSSKFRPSDSEWLPPPREVQRRTSSSVSHWISLQLISFIWNSSESLLQANPAPGTQTSKFEISNKRD